MNRRDAIKGIGGLTALLFSSCRGLDMPKWPEQGEGPIVSYDIMDGPVNNVPLVGGGGGADTVEWEVFDHNSMPSYFSGTQVPDTNGLYEGVATNLSIEGVYNSRLIARNKFGEQDMEAPIWVHNQYSDMLRENIEDLFDIKSTAVLSVATGTWVTMIMAELNPEELSLEAQDSLAKLQNYQTDIGERDIGVDKISIVGDSVVYHLDNPGFYRFDGSTFDKAVEKVKVGNELATKIREIYER